jgi:cupin 2 domain-containing protein
LNLFELPDELPGDELFEPVAEGAGVLVERIVSTGQATPPGEWLEGERDEWVVLLRGEAELAFANGTRAVLSPGDHLVIAAGVRHRVERTSADPPCIWIAVHAHGLGAPGNAPA